MNQNICLLSFACEEGCLAFTLLFLTIKFTICLTNEQLDASPGFDAMGTCLASPLWLFERRPTFLDLLVKNCKVGLFEDQVLVFTFCRIILTHFIVLNCAFCPRKTMAAA